MDWCGYVSRDINFLSDTVEAEHDTVFVEEVAYHFALMAMHNLSKVVLDENMIAALQYHAAQGLMRGVVESLAKIDPKQLTVADERKN